MGIRCFLCPPHTIFETALAGPSLSKIQLAAGGAGFASSNAHVSKNKCAVMQPTITYFACSGWWNLRKPKVIMALGGVKSMKPQKNNIARNLTTLRQLNKYSQEDVAEQIGVSRQAVAKWEAGQSVPDILNCAALAKLYDVELEALIHHDQEQIGFHIPPRGKHIFGAVRVGERGQIVLPKQARDIFQIKPGDRLVILGDENPEHPGIALMKEEFFLGIAQLFKTALNVADTPDGKETMNGKYLEHPESP
jgi:hypothetical protein